MIEVGRVCVKIAGRDAGLKCVVVEVLDKFVLVDGQTRRRKVNPAHLEPLDQKLAIEAGASHAHVAAAFKDIGVEVVDRKPKAKAPSVKPVKPAVAKPVKKPVAKKVVKPVAPTS